MAKIFYGVMGEGRGHATRARAVLEGLRHQHEVTVFTHHYGYTFLSEVYRDTNVRVIEIPGLHFHYNDDRSVNMTKTIKMGLSFLYNIKSLIAPLRNRIRVEQPDLVLTDFEPLIARAAKAEGVPFYSINHQHFLLVNDFRELPFWLQWRAIAMRQFVSLFYEGQEKTIVSSFFFAPLRRQFEEKVLQVGVMLRPEIFKARKEYMAHGEHLVAYFRRFASQQSLEALKTSGHEVHIYGLGEQPRDGNLIYKPVSEHGFIKDLATCKALISTAGNQLVGEAQFLEKPVLAMPEFRNFEQHINAFYLQKSGGGSWIGLEDLTASYLRSFLEKVNIYRDNIMAQKMNGNTPTLQAIQGKLVQLGTAPENKRLTAHTSKLPTSPISAR